MKRIFISYSRQDEVFARQLATALSEAGADVWIDVEDIPAGMKWSSAIQEGLDSAEGMIVIISPDSMASGNVEDEWQYFMDQGRPVIPVRWRPSKMSFQLHRLQYIDFHEQSFETGFQQLLTELQRHGVGLDGPASTPAMSTSSTPSSEPQSTPQPTTAQSAPAGQSRLLLYGGVGLVAMLVMVILLVLGEPDGALDETPAATNMPTSAPTASDQDMQQQAVESPTPTPTATVAPQQQDMQQQSELDDRDVDLSIFPTVVPSIFYENEAGFQLHESAGGTSSLLPQRVTVAELGQRFFVEGDAQEWFQVYDLLNDQTGYQQADFMGMSEDRGLLVPLLHKDYERNPAPLTLYTAPEATAPSAEFFVDYGVPVYGYHFDEQGELWYQVEFFAQDQVVLGWVEESFGTFNLPDDLLMLAPIDQDTTMEETETTRAVPIRTGTTLHILDADFGDFPVYLGWVFAESDDDWVLGWVPTTDVNLSSRAEQFWRDIVSE